MKERISDEEFNLRRDEVLTDLIIRMMAMERLLIEQKIIISQDFLAKVAQVRDEIVAKALEHQKQSSKAD